MYEAQSVPSENKSNKWTMRVWSAVGGAAVGAAIASGIWWFAMWEKERRHQAEIAWMIAHPAERVIGAGLNAVGELISGEGSAANPTGFVTKVSELFSGGGSATADAKNETTAAKPETPPTKEELASYFDGKTLPLPDGDKLVLSSGEQSGKTCVMTKEGVEAVDKGVSQSTYGDIQVFVTPITFLYKATNPLKATDARYAVSVQVQHKPVGDKTAFFGFTVIKVAKQ